MGYLKLTSFSFDTFNIDLTDFDLIIDCRDLPTPKIRKISKLTGLDVEFQSEFYEIKEVKQFLRQQLYKIRECSENKIKIDVAVGCHRSKHRSIATVEWIKGMIDNETHVLSCHKHFERNAREREKYRLNKRDQKVRGFYNLDDLL